MSELENAEFNAEEALENYLLENWESIQGEVEEIVRRHVADTGGRLVGISGTNPDNLKAHVARPARPAQPEPCDRPEPRGARRRRRRR
jgi:hypothetical protein